MKDPIFLVRPEEVEEYVLGLWSDGAIRDNHLAGGPISDLVKRFARTPRIFFTMTDPSIEWSHFSTWWGAIALGEYDNPAIRDLRYLHEIYHGATMPYVRDLSLEAMEVRNFENERRASAYTEMAVYLDLPHLRKDTFDHPIFADRFLYPNGAWAIDRKWAKSWREDRDTTFHELLVERMKVVLAEPHEVDPTDEQIIWLRRYPQQGRKWVEVWADRHRYVDDAMLTLRERAVAGDGRQALKDHYDWLQSPSIAEGTGIPFIREARSFEKEFRALIVEYNDAMNAKNLRPEAHITGRNRA